MKPLRILAFGAHPDDCEIYAGGCAAMWARQGHKVKFVSTTNGDVGHAFKSGKELADIRKKEVEEAAAVLGIETEVLDIHDGELMPTLENRLTFVRLIREWKADIIIGHRPYDYHPDHRYNGVLMQDASFMVTVKHTLPEVECLTHNPVFLYSYDNFQTPIPFNPTIVVPVDESIEQKMDAIWCLESQIESLLTVGNFIEIDPVPTDPVERQQRKIAFTKDFQQRWSFQADKYRSKIEELYGSDIASKSRFAESFEVCEYGRQPSREELLQLFPQVNF